MICPKCKSRTEVLETVQREAPVTRRRRRCLACGNRFSTIEALIAEHARMAGDPEELAQSVRRLIGGRRRNFDAEAIAAAIAVDRRKAKIAREQRERHADEDRAPSRLNRETLKRELGRY